MRDLPSAFSSWNGQRSNGGSEPVEARNEQALTGLCLGFGRMAGYSSRQYVSVGLLLDVPQHDRSK
jgi:hypothetical protein